MGMDVDVETVTVTVAHPGYCFDETRLPGALVANDGDTREIEKDLSTEIAPSGNDV